MIQLFSSASEGEQSLVDNLFLPKLSILIQSFCSSRRLKDNTDYIASIVPTLLCARRVLSPSL